MIVSWWMLASKAMTLGDRVAVLKPVANPNESNLQQIDTPQNLYLRPSDVFVAGFIGSPAMNFLYAEIAAAGSGISAKIVGTEHEIVLPTNSRKPVRTGFFFPEPPELPSLNESFRTRVQHIRNPSLNSFALA